MFIIEPKEIDKELLIINNYLSKCLWMDFTLSMAHYGKVELFGAIDQTYNNYLDNYEIKIEFEQPYFISSLFEWSTDTSKPFIRLASKDEEKELNAKYRIEQGNYIFKINVEDYDSPPIFIAAKKLSCKILNHNPFPKNN